MREQKTQYLTLVVQTGFGQPDYAYDAERRLGTYNYDRNVSLTGLGTFQFAGILLTDTKLPE